MFCCLLRSSFCYVARYHNKKDTKKIGDQIKFLREKQGWYIEDISAMTGFSRSTLTAIENGSNTDTSHLIEVAKAIGVQPSQFFNVALDMKPRHPLTGKRKEQKKLTYKIKEMVDEGFFNDPKIVRDVKQALIDNYKIKVDGGQISVILVRLVNNDELKSTKRGRKNLYSTKRRSK